MKKLLIGFMAFTLLYGCGGNKEKNAKGESQVFYVETMKLKKMDLKEEIVIHGDIKANEEAVIYPRIKGKLIKNVVREGDYVKKDEPVALVKKDDVGVVYEPAPVPSTISGVVGMVYQDVGNDVDIMTPIALVVDQSKVKIQFYVPEKYMSQIHVGQSIYFKVDAYPDKKFYSKISKISPVVDKVSKTFFAESVYENTSNLLKSGMTAEVHLILKERKNTVAVPVGAVVYRDNKAYVYLVDRKNNVAVEKELIPGLLTSDWIEAKNLKEGEEIITVGLYGIKNGSKIKIVN